MINKLFLAFIFLGLLSCNYKQSLDRFKKNGDNTYSVESDDNGMNLAIDSARATFAMFDQAFISKKFDTSTFSIKVKFPTPDGGHEHMWTKNLAKKNGDYYGTIDEAPEATKMVKLGDRIKIDKDYITDWMYSDSGKLQGGFTIKVIRQKLSPAERKQFDKIFPLKID